MFLFLWFGDVIVSIYYHLYCHILPSLYVFILVYLHTYIMHAVCVLCLMCSQLHYGVPQGSVLSPILFVLDIQPLSNLIK